MSFDIYSYNGRIVREELQYYYLDTIVDRHRLIPLLDIHHRKYDG